jgi:hypothetical protein
MRVVLSAIRWLGFTFVRYGGSTLPSPRSFSSAGEVGGRALLGIKGSATYRASCALAGQNTASVPQAQSRPAVQEGGWNAACEHIHRCAPWAWPTASHGYVRPIVLKWSMSGRSVFEIVTVRDGLRSTLYMLMSLAPSRVCSRPGPGGCVGGMLAEIAKQLVK